MSSFFDMKVSGQRISPITERQARKKRLKRQKWAFLLVIIGAILALGYTYPNHFHKTMVSSRKVIARTVFSSPSLSAQKSKSQQMKVWQGVINQFASDHSDLIWGISIIDLKTGAHIDYNGTSLFIAASTTKLITASYFLNQVQNGSASLDQMLGDYTAEYQLEQMVNQSNNDSWYFFNNLLGYPALEAYTKKIGISSYDSTTNSLDSNDMALLLQKLYNGQLLNKQYTDQLLSYMQNTNEESYIPAGLGSDLTVYHKTGLLDDNVHDGAIIDDGKNPFVLVIYSNGKGYPDYDERVQLFKELTQKIMNTKE